MYQVLIRSMIPEDKRTADYVAEWAETIEAASKSAASRRANRWLSRELFNNDYANIRKWQLDEHCQVWDLGT